jgi:hypothetical protein
MNFVGKILTVLISVMSLVFMTMAIMVYATHTNWRDVVMNPKTGLKQKLDNLTAERDNLQKKFEMAKKELDTERITKGDQLTKLENTVDELRGQQTKLEKQNQDLKVSEGEAVATMNKTQETLKKLREELTALRGEIRQAQLERDQSFQKAVALADSLQQAVVQVKSLEGEKTDLGVDITRMRDLLRVNDINPDQDPSGLLPPVSGQVVAVVGGNSVELSIGADDGLKKGHRLEVFRNTGGENRYIGRVEVVETSPDKAVARIIPEYRKAAVREGDSVTSKFN